MNGFASVLLTIMMLLAVPQSDHQAIIECARADQDMPLTLDAASAFWRDAHVVMLENDRYGKQVPGFRTTVRSRWTHKNLYFLFVSPYDELYLKPSPITQQETNQLWNWDVAEAFIGSDFNDIQRYKEFEVSPQGEWLDLDIDLHKPHHEDGWKWNSGFEVVAHVDEARHTWSAAMLIPFSAIDHRLPAIGNTLRINLFLSEGPPARHHELAWQAPMQETFHVPERFGLIRLVNK